MEWKLEILLRKVLRNKPTFDLWRFRFQIWLTFCWLIYLFMFTQSKTLISFIIALEFGIKRHVEQQKEIQNRETIPYSCYWLEEIFIDYVPRDSSTHYPAYYGLLHCQTPTLMPAGKQFEPFLWVWPRPNWRPTAWGAHSNHSPSWRVL